MYLVDDSKLKPVIKDYFKMNGKIKSMPASMFCRMAYWVAKSVP